MPLLPLSALSADFRVALAVALGAAVALEVASSPSVLPRVFALPVGYPSSVASVASFLGIFRKVILEPDLSSVRFTSILAATRSASTSLIRRTAVKIASSGRYAPLPLERTHMLGRYS